ncbi:MAG: glycosyl hydrolase, partial [Candidatus Dadabacteria bacterium]
MKSFCSILLSNFLVSFFNISVVLIIAITAPVTVLAQQKTTSLENTFKNPPASAAPWVFWYWLQASVSKVGITADLQAMKDAGIGGAYLMPIK